MEEKINTFQADGRHEARSHVKSKKTLTSLTSLPNHQ